jgi:hypothetical protein
MRRLMLVFAVACLFFPACGKSPPAPSAKVQQPVSPYAVGDLLVGEPIQHDNLTIFPVSSRALKDVDRFITLDEGLAAGTVEVLEMGAVESRQAQEVENDVEAADDPHPAGEASPDPFEDPFGGPPPDPFGSGSVAPADAGQSVDPFAVPAEDVAEEDPFAVPAEEVTEEDPFAVPAGEAAGDDPFGSATAAGVGSLATENPFSNDGDAVNRLMIVNRSDRPLYLMPGEIIIGGSQDRVIAHELVIAPGAEPTPIDVFCVEHGRWGDRDPEEFQNLLDEAVANENGAFSGNLSLVVSQTRGEEAAAEANGGKFVATVGNVNKETRLAVQDAADQGEVWQRVAVENGRSGVDLTPSGTFTANYADRTATARLVPYITAIREPIAKTERVVGALVAVNGKLESLDVFESTPLFQKLWPKLLKSYALDAANATGEETSGEEVCTRQAARAFLAEAAEGRAEESEGQDGIALVRRSNKRVIAFSAEDSASAGMGGLGGMGGFGGALHSSGFAK